MTAITAATGGPFRARSGSWGALFLSLALYAWLGPAVVCQSLSQTFSVRHAFTPVSGPDATNSDGANPSAGLILSGSTLFGTAVYGGDFGRGTVFSVNTDGSSFTTRYRFGVASGGANPIAALALANSTLYGAASAGGSAGAGAVFALNTNGAGYSNLYSFSAPSNNGFGIHTNSDGAYPYAGLLMSGNSLYGTANNGGSSGQGTIFNVSSATPGFVTLHSFGSGTGGAYSSAGLILLGQKLYGANYANLGNGTVFAIGTNGTGFTNYYAFSPGHPNNQGVLTNSDGSNPRAKLVFDGGTLYGTTENGGKFGRGTVFAISPDGTMFSTLHHFAGGTYGSSGLYTNSDGANPSAELVLSGNHLYGTAYAGGLSGNGTLFMLNTDGSGFQTLYSFSATPAYPAPQTNYDGANPAGGLVLSGFDFYGTTSSGGTAGNGTVFNLSFAPRLTIAAPGANVVLAWPSNAAGFDYSGFKLQSTAMITGPFTNIAGATSPYTNPVANAQQFFRLSQ